MAPQTASAQQTDERWLLALGLLPISYRHSSIEQARPPEKSSNRLNAELGGPAVFALGRGIGSWVFALELGLHYSSDEDQTVDITSSASQADAATHADVWLGPSARCVFGGTAVRPFLEAGVGVGFAHSESPSPTPIERITTSTTLLSAWGGPGLQLRLTDTASLDALLRVQYSAGSGDVRVVVTYPNQQPFSETVEMSTSEIALALGARLSIWI